MRLNGIFIEHLDPKTLGSNPNSCRFTPITLTHKSWLKQWGENHLSGWIHVHAVVGAERQTPSPTKGAVPPRCCWLYLSADNIILISYITHHASFIRCDISYNGATLRFPWTPMPWMKSLMWTCAFCMGFVQCFCVVLEASNFNNMSCVARTFFKHVRFTRQNI
jgi:hypothetical protein